MVFCSVYFSFGLSDICNDATALREDLLKTRQFHWTPDWRDEAPYRSFTSHIPTAKEYPVFFQKKGHIFKNTSDIAIFTKGPPQRSKGPPPNIAPHKTIPLQATLKVNFTAKRQGPGNLWMIKLWTLWDNLIPSTRRSLVYDTIDLIFAKPYKLQNASRQ